jgi:hypothetical protein
VTSFNFTGSGVTASAVGSAVTVNVPGGSGSGTVTSVGTTGNLTGGPITTTGTLDTVSNPTFSTSVTSPLVIGGTAASSSLTLESTSGTGTSDSIIFKTGSQLVRQTIDTNGNVKTGTGNFQGGNAVLYTSTTNATPSVLTSNGSAAGTTNQIVLSNNSAFTFSVLIVARQQAAGGTSVASWKIEGIIRREGTAASTTLVNSALTTFSNTPAWAIAVSADTTNGALAITATGAASTNIRWSAFAQTSEVIYA